MKQRFRYFLYDNRKKKFMEVRDGSLCGRDGTLRFPDDDLVSQSHCRFTVVGNEVYIEDLGSTNHTFVNTVAILPHKRRRLRLNDVVEFGGQRLILTHQNNHPPQNTQDIGKAKRVYKGVRKADGSLTSCITGFITKRTKILLDQATFRQLRLKRAWKPVHQGAEEAARHFVRSLIGYSVAALIALGGYFLIVHGTDGIRSAARTVARSAGVVQ
jgi:hypothetical protein